MFTPQVARTPDICLGRAVQPSPLSSCRRPWQTPACMEGQLSCVDVGGASVAFRTLEGRGDHDLVLLPDVFFAMEAFDGDPNAAQLLDGLRTLGRVVVFDPTGTGMSDPQQQAGDWSYARVGRDLNAVIGAARLSQPAVIAEGFNAPAAAIASTARDDAHRLILFEPYNPWVWDIIGHDVLNELGARSSIAGPDPELVAPDRADDPAFRDWLVYSNQLAARPRARSAMFGGIDEAERDGVRQAYQTVDAPTLVIQRRDVDRELFGFTAESWPAVSARLPGTREEVAGRDRILCGAHVDEVLRAIGEFVTGRISGPLTSSRKVEAVLFTDIADSTRLAGELGDTGWKASLDRHDDTSRRVVTRNGGTVVKTTGDGILALLPSVTAALRSSISMHEALAAQGLDIRAGVHVGDVEHRGDDASGITVNIAARAMGRARPGTTLATEAVVQGSIGAPFEFTVAGEFDLKGVPGSWALHEVRSAP